MAVARGLRKTLVRRLAELAALVERRLPHDFSADALTLVAPVPLVMAERERFDALAPWLMAGADEWSRPILEELFAASGVLTGASRGWLRAEDVAAMGANHELAEFARDPHYFEELLKSSDGGQRRKRGVFFTPLPVVEFIVRETDRLLGVEFGLEWGLADEGSGDGGPAFNAFGPPRSAPSKYSVLSTQYLPTTPLVRILDPAAGTGGFLLTVLGHIHSTLSGQWQLAELSADQQLAAWNEYVPRLLPRLAGIEMLPAPCLLARLQLALRLAELGYAFASPGRIGVELGDALQGPSVFPAGQLLAQPFTVLLGNPPFSGISENKHPWIERLVSDYLKVNGRPLGERKHWLKDDYVKFLRLAQWRIEASGSGIVGFVTNHGYLDNATFRGLRQQLAQAFSRITLIDLHGNRKKHEVSPEGSRDENVFGIDQGVAIGLFRRNVDSCATGLPVPSVQTDTVSHTDDPTGLLTGLSLANQTIQFAELFGDRESKFDRLGGQLPAEPVVVSSPHYRFVPSTESDHPEYLAGIKLTKLLPLNVTAPVTARDAFVVAFTKTELIERMETFRDLTVPDDEIRRRYFTNTRSAKYVSGDTRGWKLTDVRRQLAVDENWQRCLRRCLYRPFDWRWVAWDERLIDWPRNEVTRHLVQEEGPRQPLALITRRQQLPNRPCSFFWLAEGLALDGVIRSDNKGSESLFLVGQTSSLPHGYLYALFHSPTFRSRYAQVLRRDFPRVLLPRDPALPAALAPLGERLIDLHCLRGVTPRSGVAEMLVDQVIPPRFPRHVDRVIFLHEQVQIPDVAEPIWSFLAGGHQPAKKWLADRRGRQLGPADAEHYGKILAAIEHSLAVLPRIDAIIESFGGFPAAFAGVPQS